MYKSAADRASDTNAVTTVTDVKDSGTYYYRITSPDYVTKDGTVSVQIDRVTVDLQYVLDLIDDAREYDATSLINVLSAKIVPAVSSTDVNALIAKELSVSALASFTDKNVGVNKDVKVTFTVTPVGTASLDNYSLTGTSVALPGSVVKTQKGFIEAKQIRVTGVGAIDFVYNHKPFVQLKDIGMTSTDVFAADSVIFGIDPTFNQNGASATVTDVNVGTHGVNVNNVNVIKLTGADAANYKVISVSCTDVTITRATPVFTWPKNMSVNYSGEPVLPAYYTVTVSGVEGDDVTFTVQYLFNGSATTPTDAGTYTVTASVATSTNYTALTETETLTVNNLPEKLAVIINQFGKNSYDGLVHKAVWLESIKGINDAELDATTYTVYYSVKPSNSQPAASFTDVTLWNTTATDVKHAVDSGRYWYAVVAKNYEPLIGYVDVEIDPVNLGMLASVTDVKVYDKTDLAGVANPILSGVVTPDSGLISVTASGKYNSVDVATADRIVVTYVVTFAEGTTMTDYTYFGNGTQTSEGNTWIVTETHGAHIEKAPLVITINDQSSVYDKTEPVISATDWTVTSGTDYDNRALGVTLSKAKGVNAGKYVISGEYTNKNYDVTFVNGEYTVTEKEITVVINPTQGIYGDVPVLPATLLTTEDALAKTAEEIAALRTADGQGDGHAFSTGITKFDVILPVNTV